MARNTRKPLPACPEHIRVCFARNLDGKCRALEDTDFCGKPCPFYKTPEQAETDREAAYDRLVAQDRGDLIQKYHVDIPAGRKAGAMDVWD